jgi:hypothetical protein
MRVQGAFSPSVEFDVAVKAPLDSELSSITLGDLMHRACEGLKPEEKPAEQMSDTPDNTRVLTASFDAKKVRSLLKNQFLDVAILVSGVMHCVRIPVAGEAVSYERDTPLFISVPASIEGAGKSTAGPRSFFGIGLGAGSWLGPVRLSLALLPLAGDSCYQDVCGTDGGGSGKNGTAAAGRLEAAVFPFEMKGMLAGSSAGLGVGLRYTPYLMELPKPEGQDWALVQGMHGVLMIFLSDYNIDSAAHETAKGPAYTLEVPLGIWLHESGAEPRAVFSGGLGFTFLLPQ